MAGSSQLLKQKGQMLLESLFIILFAIGTLFSLSLIEKIAKKEIQKHRLHKKNYKYKKARQWKL